MKKKLKAVIFDFDGVLCSGRFYHTIKKTNPVLFEKINQRIFKKSKDLVKSWMRGEFDYKKFNQIISQELNVESALLDRELEKSVKSMQLNKYLLEFAQDLKRDGIKTAILTDNMDVFDNILVPHYNLAQYFDEIFSSSEYKILKEDNNGELLKKLLAKLGVSFDEILVVDDSEKFGEFVLEQGGSFYLYDGCFGEFCNWFKEKFGFCR